MNTKLKFVQMFKLTRPLYFAYRYSTGVPKKKLRGWQSKKIFTKEKRKKSNNNKGKKKSMECSNPAVIDLLNGNGVHC